MYILSSKFDLFWPFFDLLLRVYAEIWLGMTIFYSFVAFIELKIKFLL